MYSLFNFPLSKLNQKLPPFGWVILVSFYIVFFLSSDTRLTSDFAFFAAIAEGDFHPNKGEFFLIFRILHIENFQNINLVMYLLFLWVWRDKFTLLFGLISISFAPLLLVPNTEIPAVLIISIALVYRNPFLLCVLSLVRVQAFISIIFFVRLNKSSLLFLTLLCFCGIYFSKNAASNMQAPLLNYASSVIDFGTNPKNKSCGMWDPEIFDRNVKDQRSVTEVLFANINGFSIKFYGCKLRKYFSTPLTYIENIGFTTLCDDRFIDIATGISVSEYVKDQCYNARKSILAYVVLITGMLLKYLLIMQILLELANCTKRPRVPILFVSFVLLFLLVELQGRYLYPLLIYMLYDNDF